MISLIAFPSILYLDSRPTMGRNAESTGPAGGPDKALGCIGITVHKSVEFSYEELATATDAFSMAGKIGEGGFGAVYFAELRGKVCSHVYFYSSLADCTLIMHNRCKLIK